MVGHSQIRRPEDSDYQGGYEPQEGYAAAGSDDAGLTSCAPFRNGERRHQWNNSYRECLTGM